MGQQAVQIEDEADRPLGGQTLEPSQSLAIGLTRAEIDQQIATAHAFPRSLRIVSQRILDMATLDLESAEECIYALPRGGKPIKGPSIRFAEILRQSYGNCRDAARVVHVDRQEGFLEAEGVFHDLETNSASSARVRRSIRNKNGRVYSEDMIIVTGNAACSIAKRNAILGGVPKPLWRVAYETVQKTIAGDIETLSVNRVNAVKAFAFYGVTPVLVFEALGVNGEEDIVLDHITVLRGMFSALKNGESTVEEMFSKPDRQTDPNYNPLVKEVVDPKTGQVTEEKVETKPAAKATKKSKPDEGEATGAASTPAAEGAAETTASSATPTISVDVPTLKAYSEALIRGEQPKSLVSLKSQFWTGKPMNFDEKSLARVKDVYTAHLRRVTGEIDIAALDKAIAEIIAR